MTLRVNEIFYSVQGEGARAGCPSIFIRLSECDLTCGFCDTEFESGKEMTLEEIYQYIHTEFEPFYVSAIQPNFTKPQIVWTGGEPALQLTDRIINFFGNKGYFQTIETNGAHKVPSQLDWITLSPKVAEHVIEKNFKHVNEVKYVRHKGQLSLPKPQVDADHYYLSPMFNGNKIDLENVQHCINLIKGDPKWKLSIQLHKLIHVL